MAYIRTRTTKAGSVSATLVEAYRDEGGRPRQRNLANLHGEPDTLRALAKLAAQRDGLRKEREKLTAEAVYADQFYERITQNALHGHQYAPAERKEIDGLMRQRRQLLERLAKIDGDLATIQKDGAIIKKHCSATPDEIQAAIQAFKKTHHDAKCLVAGLEFAAGEQLREAKAALRRLSI
jgi:small-conductance mechanosensitive channel